MTPVKSSITIHILSDSLGETADAVARAAAAQFAKGAFTVERLPKVYTREDVRRVVTQHCGNNCIFFFTLAGEELRDEMDALVHERHVNAVDILGPAVLLLSSATGVQPLGIPGTVRTTDEAYFDRIEAMEFAIKHDDGQHPEDLFEAEAVLIGVSRTSKTPLSMYLASKGFRAANIPLVHGSRPPRQLFEVDPRKVFGLISNADTLVDVRNKRMDELGAFVPGYSDREQIERELDEASSVMRRVGCLVLRTDNRAIEETAQDVIRHLRGRLKLED